ncbi:MAG TPA: hypothetical protein VLK33_05465, partial [Terriglobales bacterium]|nr:hypothetical protein [Terriglobales bacterium]
MSHQATVRLCTVLAVICASTALASAQISSSAKINSTVAATSTPVAFVYVSNTLKNSTSQNQVNGYAAAADGSLTPIPGSPFPASLSYLATTGHWLLGVLQSNSPTENGQSINSYSIATNGALTFKDKANAVESGGGIGSIYLDHTGSSLYADYDTTNNDYLNYSVNHSTGALSHVSTLPGGPADFTPVNFIGNDVYAYSSSCYHFDPAIISVKRASDGSLARLSGNSTFPTEKSGGFYCPLQAATDPTNHVAIAMQPLTLNWDSDGAWQLATYTADSSGHLTTTSTNENMPSVVIGTVRDYRMSPSGKFLAVGGSGGLQLFHFNGANPITKL